jgi:hypothetical protein
LHFQLHENLIAIKKSILFDVASEGRDGLRFLKHPEKALALHEAMARKKGGGAHTRPTLMHRQENC